MIFLRGKTIFNPWFCNVTIWTYKLLLITAYFPFRVDPLELKPLFDSRNVAYSLHVNIFISYCAEIAFKLVDRVVVILWNKIWDLLSRLRFQILMFDNISNGWNRSRWQVRPYPAGILGTCRRFWCSGEGK